MEKINFVNNSLPAINDTNLNKLQDNVEDAIQEVQDDVDTKLTASNIKATETSSDTDTYSCNYINEITSDEIIYQNSSGSNEGVTFSRTITNDDTLEIEFKCNTYGYKTMRIDNALNKDIILDYEVVASVSVNQSGFSRFTISSTGINLVSSGMINTSLTGSVTSEQGNKLIYITKVKICK